MTTFEPPQPNAALVVGPDDHLVLNFKGVDLETAAELRNHLKERWPQLVDRVLLVFGAADISVVAGRLGASSPGADSLAAPPASE